MERPAGGPTDDLEEIEGLRDLRPLGEGGFSVVYRAYQARFDRTVAVKVLRIDLSDDAAVRRFERECAVTGRLTGHPNIVTVLDSGVTRHRRPYLLLPYFSRGSLADRPDAGRPMAIDEVLRVGVKLSGALATAHAAGVVHRDVKPENVFVSEFGEPALGDFGISVVEERATQLTLALSPVHAAPESFDARGGTPAADQYMLASTLYQLLAGRPAFTIPEGEGPLSLLRQVLDSPPPPIDRSDLPPSLWRIVATGMAKDPGDRFPSVLALGEALRDVQAELGLPRTDLTVAPVASHAAPPTVVGAPPAPSPAAPEARSGPAVVEGSTSGRPPARRRLVVAAVVAVAVLALVGVLAAVVLGGDDSGGDEAATATTVVPEGAPSEVSETASIDIGDRPLAVASSTEGVWAVSNFDNVAVLVDPATDQIAGTAEVGSQPSNVAVGDGEVWVVNGFLQTVTRLDAETLDAIATIALDGRPEGIAVTKAAVWVALTDMDTVVRLDPRTDEVVASIPVGDEPVGVAADDDAVWVSNANADTVSHIDPETDEVVATIDVGSRPAGLAIGEGAVWVANTTDDTVSRVDPEANREVAIVPTGGGPVAVAVGEGAVWVADRDDGTVTVVDPETDRVAATVTVGGEPVAVAVGHGAVWVADRDTDRVVRLEPN